MPYPKSTEPSPQQKVILQFIIDEICRTGTSPTVREIGRSIGLVFPNGAQNHLKVLEERGYITRVGADEQNNPRRIVPLKRVNGVPWELDIQGAIRILKKIYAETQDGRIKAALESLGC